MSEPAAKGVHMAVPQPVPRQCRGLEPSSREDVRDGVQGRPDDALGIVTETDQVGFDRLLLPHTRLALATWYRSPRLKKLPTASA